MGGRINICEGAKDKYGSVTALYVWVSVCVTVAPLQVHMGRQLCVLYTRSTKQLSNSF